MIKCEIKGFFSDVENDNYCIRFLIWSSKDLHRSQLQSRLILQKCRSSDPRFNPIVSVRGRKFLKDFWSCTDTTEIFPTTYMTKINRRPSERCSCKINFARNWLRWESSDNSVRKSNLKATECSISRYCQCWCKTTLSESCWYVYLFAPSSLLILAISCVWNWSQ